MRLKKFKNLGTRGSHSLRINRLKSSKPGCASQLRRVLPFMLLLLKPKHISWIVASVAVNRRDCTGCKAAGRTFSKELFGFSWVSDINLPFSTLINPLTSSIFCRVIWVELLGATPLTTGTV